MKSLLLAGVTAMALTLSGQAFSQGVTLEFAPEQRTHIKEYVTRERVPRATIKERIMVGGTVPADVELREAPADWGPSVRRYRYYNSEYGVHFVDPDSRRVIYDID
jgi:hypothetical protein